MIPTTTGLFDGITDAEYHADQLSLSSSGARQLLRCPAKFRYQQDNPQPHKDVFDFGSAAHTLVLGKGDAIAAIDSDSWRSKAAQEAREIARANHQIPLLRADYAKAKAMADAVREHPLAAELLADGVAEQSGYWMDDQTWQRLRFRPDWITTYQGSPTIVDYKTSQTADPQQFARKAYDFGYHVQQAWYSTGYEAVTGEPPEFLFIVQEKDAPFLVSVFEFDSAAVVQGQADMRAALDVYSACQESGVWPGYSDDVQSLRLPPWAHKQRRDT